MGRFFSYDGAPMGFLAKLGDLILLNFLIIVFSLPIITMGAAITAGHYTMLKNVRGEGYIFRHFWKAFKENLKQATVIWLLFLGYIGVALAAFFLLIDGSVENASTVQGVILAGAIFCVAVSMWIFPLQSKFVNKISRTFRLAFILTFKHIFRTILMLAVTLLPFLVNAEWFTLLLLFGYSLPIYLCARIYNKVFEELEKMVLEG